MTAAMRLAPAALLAVLLLPASPARAQALVSEQVQGNLRICNYAGNNGLLSGTAQGRQYRVGIGENCPVTPPLTDPNRTAPPTAALTSESSSAEGRVCVYERWGSSWTVTLRDQTACPPAAGMVVRSRPRFTDPVAPPEPSR